MSENLKLTLSTSHAYEVATFSGGTASWTPNGDASGNDYNEAINANTKVNANGGNWYYPWYAATAGQGTNTASPTINRSICPKGWRLPDNSSNPSFYNLVTTRYGITTGSAGIALLKSSPLSYTSLGYYHADGLSDTPAGYYWSASPNTSDSIRAYMLFFRDSSSYTPYLISPQDSTGKFIGGSVRCVAIP